MHIFNDYVIFYDFLIRVKDNQDKMCSMYRTRDSLSINDKQNKLRGNFNIIAWIVIIIYWIGLEYDYGVWNGIVTCSLVSSNVKVPFSQYKRKIVFRSLKFFEVEVIEKLAIQKSYVAVQIFSLNIVYSTICRKMKKSILLDSVATYLMRIWVNSWSFSYPSLMMCLIPAFLCTL